ncbi:MAG: hypothetical protein D3926_21740 [Desulfobacteraceae bacterium]|nr:MAG: hypothetical protein D3926_21740 [Desulfobacteraceae bacterium]
MKQSITKLIKTVGIVSVSFMIFVAMAQAASVRMADTSKKRLAPHKIQKNLNLRRIGTAGIDPAVINLQVAKSPSGRLTVTATVKNIGTQNFVSRANQAAVVLQVYNPRLTGPSAYETIARRGFTHLSASGTLVVTGSHQLDGFVEWSDPSLDFGECQYNKEVIAMITYDPDITMDGNEQNDDARNNNNMKKQNVNYIVECPW